MYYDGGFRIIEPYCYGITTAGNPGLRAYQKSGHSNSRKMGWKMFDLRTVSNVSLTDEFFNQPQNGYKRGDKGMAKIIAQL